MRMIMPLFAFAVLVGFLAILLIHVPRIDLICVVGVTVALAGWDLMTNPLNRR